MKFEPIHKFLYTQTKIVRSKYLFAGNWSTNIADQNLISSRENSRTLTCKCYQPATNSVCNNWVRKRLGLSNIHFRLKRKTSSTLCRATGSRVVKYWIKGGKWAREKLARPDKNIEIVEPKRLQRINLDSCGEQLLENNLDTKGHRRFVQPEKKQRRNRATVSRF